DLTSAGVLSMRTLAPPTSYPALSSRPSGAAAAALRSASDNAAHTHRVSISVATELSPETRPPPPRRDFTAPSSPIEKDTGPLLEATRICALSTCWSTSQRSESDDPFDYMALGATGGGSCLAFCLVSPGALPRKPALRVELCHSMDGGGELGAHGPPCKTGTRSVRVTDRSRDTTER